MVPPFTLIKASPNAMLLGSPGLGPNTLTRAALASLALALYPNGRLGTYLDSIPDADFDESNPHLSFYTWMADPDAHGPTRFSVVAGTMTYSSASAQTIARVEVIYNHSIRR